MAEQSSLHGYLEWTKQRIDEMDATLASLEAHGSKVGAALIADLEKRRAEFEAKAKKATEAGQAAALAAQAGLETQWSAFEAQVKTYFDNAGKELQQQQTTFRERAAAQAEAWRGAAERLQGEATKAAAAHRSQVDAAVERMKAQGAEAEAQLEKLRQAGNQSWSALSTALAQSRQAVGRATLEAWAAVSRATPPKS